MKWADRNRVENWAGPSGFARFARVRVQVWQEPLLKSWQAGPYPLLLTLFPVLIDIKYT